jgi:hypothetical protein
MSNIKEIIENSACWDPEVKAFRCLSFLPLESGDSLTNGKLKKLWPSCSRCFTTGSVNRKTP